MTSVRTCWPACERRPSSPTAGSASSRRCAPTSSTSRCPYAASATCSRRRNEAITPMSPEELERAIVAPADRAGLVVEPSLLAAIIADVANARRAPVAPVRADGARRAATTAGAAPRRVPADRRRVGRARAPRRAAVRGAGRARPSACRQLFLRLVTLGDGGEDTRRRVRRSALTSLGDPRAMDGVIETYGRHRLAVLRPGSRQPGADDRDRARGDPHGVGPAPRVDRRGPRRPADAGSPGRVRRGMALERARSELPAPRLQARPDGGVGGVDLRRDGRRRPVLPRGERRPTRSRTGRRGRAAGSRALSGAPGRRPDAGLVAVLTVAAVVASTLTVLAVGQRNRAPVRSGSRPPGSSPPPRRRTSTSTRNAACCSRSRRRT